MARNHAGGHGWQLILADLALILFLVTLSALAQETQQGRTPALAAFSNGSSPADQGIDEVAPSQALFRPDPQGPQIAEWLAQRPLDPRATLTIFARHSGSDRDAVWEQAQNLADDAASVAAGQKQGFAVRVIVTEGRASDIYASLAYDTR